MLTRLQYLAVSIHLHVLALILKHRTTFNLSVGTVAAVVTSFIYIRIGVACKKYKHAYETASKVLNK